MASPTVGALMEEEGGGLHGHGEYMLSPSLTCVVPHLDIGAPQTDPSPRGFARWVLSGFGGKRPRGKGR